jgi:hypothetical protein
MINYSGARPTRLPTSRLMDARALESGVAATLKGD